MINVIDHADLLRLLRLDSGRAEIIEGRPAPTEVDPEHVRSYLREAGWHIGPVDDPAGFAAWLRDDQPSDFAIDNSHRIFVLAVYRFSRPYPDASHTDLANAAGQLAGWATGFGSPYPSEDVKSDWAERVVVRMIGGTDRIMGPGTYSVPTAPGVAPAQLLALVEALYFLPLPAADVDWDRIRQVCDILSASRDAFRSRQIAHARALLEEMLP